MASLYRKEILCCLRAGMFWAQGLDEHFRLPGACPLLQQDGWGCPPILACAKGGASGVCLEMCGHQERSLGTGKCRSGARRMEKHQAEVGKGGWCLWSILVVRT